jgi:hypothetical protein
MSGNASSFWHLRILGKISQARELFSRLGTEDPAEHALMRNSLTRAERGGRDAQAELNELDQAGLFKDGKPFQYFYQCALNFYAQGLYSHALEELIMATTKIGNALEDLMAHSMRLICLHNLNFDTGEAWIEMGACLAKYDQLENRELAAFTRRIVKVIHLRELFNDGQAAQVRVEFADGEWSQADYICSWVASLPYTRVDRSVVQNSLERLTREADFYLRNYRLQTLVGRAYSSPAGSPVAWGDRFERLYLWTWRWLVDPSLAHAQALTAILMEVERWDGLDVLTHDEMHMARNAMNWLMLFEPVIRARFSVLLRRVNSTGAPPPLFAYEDLWIQHTGARLDGPSAAGLQKRIESHPLNVATDLAFGEACASLVPEAELGSPAFLVDGEAGQIYRRGKLVARSEPLAHLLAGLAPRGKLNFESALSACYGIQDFDPEIHGAKIQNLIVRARRLLGRSGRLTTKGAWIFLEMKKGTRLQAGRPAGRARLSLPPRQRAPAKAERRRNARSLEVLLKEASSLRDRDFTRADLERTLNIPKPTLTRYLKAWIDRKWITKSGSGRKVSYRITFFDS